MIRPVYIHTPTSFIYEYPVVTPMPLGQYSMSNNGANWFSNSNYYNNFPSGYQPNDLAYPVQYYTMSGYNNPLGANYQMYGQLGMLPGGIA
jgi:hypothetical protein